MRSFDLTNSSERCGQAALEPVRDDQREENERLDERQAENHRRLDTSGCARIARDAFERGGCGTTLTEGTTEDCKSDGKAGAHAEPAERIELVRCAFLRKRHGGEEDHRGRDGEGKLALERHPDLLLSDHAPRRGLMLRMKNSFGPWGAGNFLTGLSPRGPGRLYERAPL